MVYGGVGQLFGIYFVEFFVVLDWFVLVFVGFVEFCEQGVYFLFVVGVDCFVWF